MSTVQPSPWTRNQIQTWCTPVWGGESGGLVRPQSGGRGDRERGWGHSVALCHGCDPRRDTMERGKQMNDSEMGVQMDTEPDRG